MKDKDIQREYGLDIVKLFCSFLVVYIHAGNDEGILNSLSAVAVPAFFIISGYLYDKVIVSEKKRRRQICRISTLACVWMILYFIWFAILLSLSEGVSLWETIKNNVSIVRVLKLVLLNAPSMGYHLWYMFALLYVLIILYIIDCCFLEKFLYILAVGLLIAGIVMPWLFWRFGIPFRVELVRNFLFEGLPLFIIGRILNKKFSDVVIAVNGYNKGKSKKVVLVVVFFILSIDGILFLLWEEHICNIRGVTSLFCGSYIVGVLLVALAVALNGWISKKKLFRFLAAWDTTGIYIIHLWVLSILGQMGMDKSFVTALITFLISNFLVLFWHKLQKTVLGKFLGG